MKQVAIRLKDSVVDRIDDFRKDPGKHGMPGVTLTRSDAIRMLIERGLMA